MAPVMSSRWDCGQGGPSANLPSTGNTIRVSATGLTGAGKSTLLKVLSDTVGEERFKVRVARGRPLPRVPHPVPHCFSCFPFTKPTLPR